MENEVKVETINKYASVKGNAGFRAEEKFGKKTTYVPSEEHPVHAVLKDAIELCSESSNIKAMNTNIGLTFVYPSLSKAVYAHILRPSRLLKLHSGLNLIIEISGTAWDKMTCDEKLALLHHELEHIVYREKRNGDLDLKLCKHNLQDFFQVIEKYGLYYIRPNLNETDSGDE